MRFRQLVIVAITLLVLGASAWADISGLVYRLPGNCDNTSGCALGIADATQATMATGSLIGGFNAPGINFATTSGTLGDFLSSGGATGVTVGAELALPMSNCNYYSTGVGDSCYSTGIVIDGFGTFLGGTTYSLYHDDGAQLWGGGILKIDKPHPQALSAPDLYTPGADTTGAYRVYYVGTNTNPEVLQLTPSPVPDGGTTVMLLGGVLVGLATLRRKFGV